MVNTFKDKKRRQIVLVLKQYLEKLDIKPSRSVLSILNLNYENEAYSATGMEKKLRLFFKSRK